MREQIGNKMCFYGKQVFQFNFDPRSMAEDLGDDVVKANTYGLKNLKDVAANFVDWMAVNDEEYGFCHWEKHFSLVTPKDFMEKFGRKRMFEGSLRELVEMSVQEETVCAVEKIA